MTKVVSAAPTFEANVSSVRSRTSASLAQAEAKQMARRRHTCLAYIFAQGSRNWKIIFFSRDFFRLVHTKREPQQTTTTNKVSSKAKFCVLLDWARTRRREFQAARSQVRGFGSLCINRLVLASCDWSDKLKRAVKTIEAF